MVRTILLALTAALAGCASDGAHDVVSCEAVYPTQPAQCERACAETPSGGVDDGNGLDQTCVVEIPGSVDLSTGKPLRGPCDARQVTEHDDDRGCCIVASGDDELVVKFVECE